MHWSPIVVLVWPMLRIFGPVGLQYAQALLVASTLIPIWALARAHALGRMAIVLVVIAAIYPTLWGNAVGDFHEMAFVPLLSATLVYALDQRKWLLLGVATLFLLCTKEDQFVILAVNGLTIFAVRAFDRSTRRAGLLIALAALLCAAFYFGAVRPHIPPALPYSLARFYDWNALRDAIVASPGTFVSARLYYLAILLVPLLFLPCISKYGLLLIPGLVEIFASHMPVTLLPGAHYSALLTGYALAAFVDGFDRLRSWNAAASAVAAGVAAYACVCVELLAPPMEYWYYLYRLPNAHDALLARTLRSLPRNAEIGSEDEIFAHLGLDSNASVRFRNQAWFLYDRTHFAPYWRDVDGPAVRRSVANGTYRIVSENDGIVVLRRSH